MYYSSSKHWLRRSPWVPIHNKIEPILSARSRKTRSAPIRIITVHPHHHPPSTYFNLVRSCSLNIPLTEQHNKVAVRKNIVPCGGGGEENESEHNLPEPPKQKNFTSTAVTLCNRYTPSRWYTYLQTINCPCK